MPVFISKIRIELILLWVLVTSVTVQAQQEGKEKNVLVLHSYHQGLEWTDNITKGIQQVLGAREDVSLFLDYLDIKRHHSGIYYEALINLHKVKAQKSPFDVIIVCDNAAFDFIKNNGNHYYPEIPVVYCGVNGLDETVAKNYPNYYGIGETVDYYGTVLAIQKMFPQKNNVLVITDNTLTGRIIQNEIEPVFKQFEDEMNFELVSSFTMDELKQRIKSLDASYVIYLLTITRDKNDVFLSYNKGISQIKSVSNVPIFGSWGFYIGKGLLGGKVISGKEQGKQAALLASQLMDKKGDSIPHFTKGNSGFVFDFIEMQHFGIRKNELPPHSKIVNKPKYQESIIRITIITQILLLLVLLFNIYRIRYKNKKAVELENLVQERTSELYRANRELEDVIQKKDKFFSILAHDLRNQIGAFLNASILLNKPAFLKKPDRVETLHKDMLKISNQTNHLLEDLLYWGLQQFKKKPRLIKSEVDLKSVLEGITEAYEINPNHIVFKFDSCLNTKIMTDPHIIKFILRNMVHNAMKFSDKDGVVEIMLREEGDKIRISIKDYGIGMDKDVVESIYNGCPIRKESKTVKTTTGIGLPTALDYLKMLGGKLEIDSEPGKGSTFTVVTQRDTIVF